MSTCYTHGHRDNGAKTAANQGESHAIQGGLHDKFDNLRGGLGRRDVLKGAAGLAAAGLVAAPMVARAQQKFICRMGHSEAIGSPLTDAFENWTKMLNEKSGGRIEAQHFPASQLGSYTQNIEQNRLGTIQVTTGGPDTEETVAPEIAATGGAPGFIYRDDAHVDRVLQGDIGREVSQIARAKTGVEFVDYGEVGFRHILSKRKVTNLDELKGLKIRTPEIKLWVDFWKKVGANPTPLRLRRAIQRALDRPDRRARSRRVLDQGLQMGRAGEEPDLTSHWFLPKATRVNARWLDSLPADLQKLVRDSAKEVFAEQRKVNRAETAKTLEELKASGVTVHQLSDTPKWREATELAVCRVRREEPGHQSDDRQDPRARRLGLTSKSGAARQVPPRGLECIHEFGSRDRRPVAGLRAPVAARISGALDLAIETVAATLFVGTVVIALIQVFFRYVLNNSLSWPEEMSRLPSSGSCFSAPRW